MLDGLRPAALAAAGVAMAVLAGCAEPERPLYPEVTFAHLHPIRVDVARVEVIPEYRPPLRPPNVDHEFPVPLTEAARIWARDRLQPTGAGGVARVTIEDASVVEVPLERSGGIEGMVTVDQAFRYDASLAVRIDIVDAGGRDLGHTRVQAQRTRTVPENLTLNQRDQVFFEMTEALMRDFNVQAEKGLRQFLADHVR